MEFNTFRFLNSYLYKFMKLTVVWNNYVISIFKLFFPSKTLVFLFVIWLEISLFLIVDYLWLVEVCVLLHWVLNFTEFFKLSVIKSFKRKILIKLI